MKKRPRQTLFSTNLLCLLSCLRGHEAWKSSSALVPTTLLATTGSLSAECKSLIATLTSFGPAFPGTLKELGNLLALLLQMLQFFLQQFGVPKKKKESIKIKKTGKLLAHLRKHLLLDLLRATPIAARAELAQNRRLRLSRRTWRAFS